MKILVDKRIPGQALKNLRHYGEVILIESSGITYDAISGHPDIYFCKTKENLIVAPNLPSNIKKQLNDVGFDLQNGKNEVGKDYPQTAHYNALITEKYLVHNLKYTDPVILSACEHLHFIDVKQAYSRCSVLPLMDDRFITSDKGIEKVLQKRGLETLYVNPVGILLPGFKNGFFGGTCGVNGQRIFFIGKLDRFPEGENVSKFLESYEIIELYNGPLIDGGSIIFLD